MGRRCVNALIYSFFNEGIPREDIWGTQSSARSQLPGPQGPLYGAIGSESFHNKPHALFRNVSALGLPPYNNNHFPHRAVEAVLDYAYTGNVELTVGSAERIYLLAHNLQCKRLMAKCIRHLTQQ